MGDIVERFTEISRRDDCFDHMVPSDVRLMLKEIVRLRADLAEAGDVISDLQTFTFTVSADMDAELRARVRTWRDRVT